MNTPERLDKIEENISVGQYSRAIAYLCCMLKIQGFETEANSRFRKAKKAITLTRKLSYMNQYSIKTRYPISTGGEHNAVIHPTLDLRFAHLTKVLETAKIKYAIYISSPPEPQVVLHIKGKDYSKGVEKVNLFYSTIDIFSWMAFVQALKDHPDLIPRITKALSE